MKRVPSAATPCIGHADVLADDVVVDRDDRVARHALDVAAVRERLVGVVRREHREVAAAQRRLGLARGDELLVEAEQLLGALLARRRSRPAGARLAAVHLRSASFDLLPGTSCHSIARRESGSLPPSMPISSP